MDEDILRKLEERLGPLRALPLSVFHIDAWIVADDGNAPGDVNETELTDYD